TGNLFVGEFGSSGSGDGQFDTLSGVAVDTDGNVYTADSADTRIQKFDSEGNFILNIGNLPGDPGLAYVVGVRIFGEDVYVLDQGSGSIQKFNTDGSLGTTIISGLIYPIGISFDDLGNIYVLNSDDFTTFQVKKYDNTGNHLLDITPSGLGWPAG